MDIISISSSLKDTSNRVAFANTLRGFAAMCVLVSHYLGVFWHRQDVVTAFTHLPAFDPETTPIPSVLLWINTSPWFHWGQYGVALFFLISGFVIPFSLNHSSRMGFIFNRLLRIYPAYFIGFSVSLLMIWYGTRYFSQEWPFTSKEMFCHYVPGLRDLMNSTHIDGIVWTLEVEVKFYLVCALAITWFKASSKKVFIIPFLLFMMAMGINFVGGAWAKAYPHTLYLAHTFVFSVQYILFMFIGVVSHFLYQGKMKRDHALMFSLALGIAFCMLWSVGPYQKFLNYIWNYFYAFLTFCFAFFYQRFFQANRIVNFFADISYPLYIVHGIYGYVLLRILLDQSISVGIMVLGVTLGAILISWIIHCVIERPCQNIGRRLSKIGIKK